VKKAIALFLIAVLISSCNRMTDNVSSAPQSLDTFALVSKSLDDPITVSKSLNAPIIVPVPIFMPTPTPAPKENVLPLLDMANVVGFLRVAAVPAVILAVAACGYFCFRCCFAFDVKKLATAKKP
jgi:hypothetical protein